MATVRITETLRGDILSKFRNDFQIRRDKQLQAILNKFDQGLIVESAWQQFCEGHKLTNEWLASWPAAWSLTDATIYIKTINDQNLPFTNFKLPAGKSYPIFFVNKADDRYPRSHMLTSPDLSEQAALCIEYHTAVKELDEEMNRSTATIRKVLDNCTTLKQALEVWPQLIDLLPAETLAKHHEPEKRYSNASRMSLSQEALDQINTAVVINKITKAL
jgi:hypothetical protein